MKPTHQGKHKRENGKKCPPIIYVQPFILKILTPRQCCLHLLLPKFSYFDRLIDMFLVHVIL